MATSNVEELKLPKLFDDPDFRFEEEEHLYFLGDTPLTGTTTWIKRFQTPFNEKYWSRRKARERGVSVKTILAEWDEARNKGTSLGTEVHDAIEHHIEHGTIPELGEEAVTRFNLFLQLANGRLTDAEFVATELQTYSKKYKIAGTFDVLTRLADGRLLVGDWKTNKKFRKGRDGYGNLLAPFSHLKDNEANIYSLQVAVYRILLEDAGLETHGAFIGYLGPDQDEPDVYFPKDLRAPVREVMEADLLEAV